MKPNVNIVEIMSHLKNIFKEHLKQDNGTEFTINFAQTMTLKMVHQRRFECCVVFTMSLCALESYQTFTSSLFQVLLF